MDAGIVVGEYDMKTSKKSNKRAAVTKFSGNMTMDQLKIQAAPQYAKLPKKRG